MIISAYNENLEPFQNHDYFFIYFRKNVTKNLKTLKVT